MVPVIRLSKEVAPATDSKHPAADSHHPREPGFLIDIFIVYHNGRSRPLAAEPDNLVIRNSNPDIPVIFCEETHIGSRLAPGEEPREPSRGCLAGINTRS